MVLQSHVLGFSFVKKNLVCLNLSSYPWEQSWLLIYVIVINFRTLRHTRSIVRFNVLKVLHLILLIISDDSFIYA